MAIERHEIHHELLESLLQLTSSLFQMGDETEAQRLTKLTRTRGGARAAATKRMNRLDEIPADQIDTETKLELAALCNLLKKHRQTLAEMNLELQALTKIHDIDGEIASSEDYNAKIELAIQRATDGSSTTITSNNSSGGNQDSRLKLPKLDLPKFDGSFSVDIIC